MAQPTLPATLTDAGLAAVAAAHGQGVQAKITHLAIGDGGGAGYAPTGAETALRGEVLRVPVTAGGTLGPYQVLVEASIPAAEPAFWVRELAYVLEDGTLLAVWSDPVVTLGWRGTLAPWVFSFVFSWSALPPGSVTVVFSDADVGALGLRSAQNQAMLRALVERTGLAWDPAAAGLAADAASRWFGGAVTIISQSRALLPAEAGLVLVDATAGDVAVTLPAATTTAMPIHLMRGDATGHVVTVAPAVGETLDGAAGVVLRGVGDWRRVQAAAAASWRTVAAAGPAQPLGALPYPTVDTTDHRITVTPAAVAGTGGTVSIPAGVAVSLARQVSPGWGRPAAVVTAAWTSAPLDAASTYYLRGQIDPASGAWMSYTAKGTDSDTAPAGGLGTPGAAAGGGFDSTVGDVLVARVVTGAAGTVPTVTALANAARLTGSWRVTWLIANDDGNTANDTETTPSANVKIDNVNWARRPRCWVGGIENADDHQVSGQVEETTTTIVQQLTTRYRIRASHAITYIIRASDAGWIQIEADA